MPQCLQISVFLYLLIQFMQLLVLVVVENLLLAHCFLDSMTAKVVV
ncbi:hypothetical protein X975_27116, partial [Stegodyphus mimosarum]